MTGGLQTLQNVFAQVPPSERRGLFYLGPGPDRGGVKDFRHKDSIAGAGLWVLGGGRGGGWELNHISRHFSPWVGVVCLEGGGLSDRGGRPIAERGPVSVGARGEQESARPSFPTQPPFPLKQNSPGGTCSSQRGLGVTSRAVAFPRCIFLMRLCDEQKKNRWKAFCYEILQQKKVSTHIYIYICTFQNKRDKQR